MSLFILLSVALDLTIRGPNRLKQLADILANNRSTLHRKKEPASFSESRF